MEFPTDAVDVESLPCAGDGEYRGAEACDVHSTECSALRGDLFRGRFASRSVERGDWTGNYGKHVGWPSRC